MTSLTDYLVLYDGIFNLSTNEEKKIEFFMPEEFVEVNDQRKPIIAYKCRPLQQPPFSPSVDLWISVNGHAIEHITIKDDLVRGLWEAFDGRHLSKLIINSLVFRSQSGKVRISDVILWFQRAV